LIHKHWKSKRGITPILATLLLIVIAVAAIVVTYAWIMTYTHNLGQQASIRLYKANVSFGGTAGGTAQNRINIDIGNSGTADTQIIQVYVGTSASTLQSQAVASMPIACSAGGVAPITVNYNWTIGATYYFKVVSTSGQYLDWPEQAPTS
jgi:flagellin-like protein